MFPRYRFALSCDDGTSRNAYPIYGENLAKEFEKESGEQFFRAKLSGDLTFEKDDYAYIMGKAFDAQFSIVISISYDWVNYSEYWKGKFFKADCDIDEDAQSISVNPSVDDDYGLLLAGMDKEYNLIDLAPDIDSIKLDKRPMVQIYKPGDNTIGCFLSGMWWEQECEEITSTTRLLNLHFELSETAWVFTTGGTHTPNDLPACFYGTAMEVGETTKVFSNGDYELVVRRLSSPGYDTNFVIRRASDGVALWSYTSVGTESVYPLTPVAGSGATGTVELTMEVVQIFARLLLDVDTYFGQDTEDIPSNDIVENNRNYKKCIGYGLDNVVFFTDAKTSTPTKWGIYQPGQYYVEPYIPGRPVFPITRASWGVISYWFAFAAFDSIYEVEGRKQFTLKDAFPLSSAISKILGKIAPAITHEGTDSYSEFLYGENPITGVESTLFLAPKSNILAGQYDQPAQKAPITLRQITDMLRDCFRCYWYLDGDKFRIEHIEFFRNGGNYSGAPSEEDVINLTQLGVSRNGKKWAFGRNQYKFDISEIVSRYEFGWMDDVTEPFEGEPIDIISKYAEEGKVSKISIQQFTSDVDYMLLNPSACSMDGFALLQAIDDNGEWVLPYYTHGDNILQNGLLSFAYLEQFYMYDLPALDYRIGDYEGEAIGVKRMKKQEIDFPCPEDPNPLFLIKTDLGYGNLEKLSINLSSRSGMATLRYENE